MARGMRNAALVLLVGAVLVAWAGVRVEATAVERRSAPPSFIVADTWYVKPRADLSIACSLLAGVGDILS